MQSVQKISTESDANEVTFVQTTSTLTSSFNYLQDNRHDDKSIWFDSFERNLSILDPISDRVSTILVWQNLSVYTREEKKNILQRFTSNTKQPVVKQLLHNLSGAITGGLWAVMGPSGSGKSTLLNALACRLDKNTFFEGEIRLNGASYNNAELKRISGYVMQDDLLNQYLTVAETLMFTAELRLPRTFTDQQRKERVLEVLNELSLTYAMNDVVGIPSKKGISGSERKRLSIAMQLLNRPQLLFLDEPTTGLDSVTALDLLYTLNGLAHDKTQDKAVTIVCSIHQPQAKIFNLFDSIVLLKAGHIVYQGPRKDTIDVFRAAGFPCPPFTNPADHILDVITPPKSGPMNTDEPSLPIEQQKNADEALIKAQPPLEIDLNMGVNKRLAQMNNLPINPTWHKQVRILLRRNFREQSRKTRIIIASVLQTCLIALLVGLTFRNIGTTQKSISRRESALFFCVLTQGVSAAMTVLNLFPAERTLILRERASGNYYVSAYFVAKITIDTCVQLPMPVLFSCIVYFLIGFQPVAGKFFLYTLFISFSSITSTSLALMISALCKTTSFSANTLPLLLEIARVFGGFLLPPSKLPKYFSWLDALSYMKYAYVGVCLNELSNLKLTCEGITVLVVNATHNVSDQCISSGEQIINERGFDYINIVGCVFALLTFIIMFRVFAFLGVRFIKN